MIKVVAFGIFMQNIKTKLMSQQVKGLEQASLFETGKMTETEDSGVVSEFEEMVDVFQGGSQVQM